MANKNTKVLRKAIAKASKKGALEVEVPTPNRNYHSDPKYYTRKVPTAIVGEGGTVSVNERRNMQMCVIRDNAFTRTVHIPLKNGKPTFAKPRKGTKGFLQVIQQVQEN